MSSAVSTPRMDPCIAVSSSHPGLKLFSLDHALTHFNLETILTKYIKEDLEFYLESKYYSFAAQELYFQCSGGVKLNTSDVESVKLSKSSSATKNNKDMTESLDRSKMECSTDNVVPGDLTPVFQLMSILSSADARLCKYILDRDGFQWKISVYDVILVFLNWGVLPESFELGAEYNQLLEPKLACPFTSEGTTKTSFPDPYTVHVILISIYERLPEMSSMSFENRVLLVRILLYASLDVTQRRICSSYTRTIHNVLNSFDPWRYRTAIAVVEGLKLTNVGYWNIVEVCCSVFNLCNDRSDITGLAACLHVLHHWFGMPGEPSLSTLVNHLSSHDLLESHKLEDVYIIAKLVSSVFNRLAIDKATCPQEVLIKMYRWTFQLRDQLKKPPNTFNIVAVAARERLARLTTKSVNTLRKLYNTSIFKLSNFTEESTDGHSN